jgi:preprotein translocase subunit SecD
MGKDNLQRGLNSVLISVPATFAVMALYYFLPGIIANISLLVNALIIFYAMSLVDASFTLPGLAGIALNLGIAVDSNVLIYERLREELVDHKQNLFEAIETAMRRAATAIIDGNMTHLIVVVVLYWFAGAEVKGFALVMGIGVFSTLAAGLIVTQVLLRRETIERDEFLRLLEGEAEADVFRVKDERARQKAAEDERAAAEAESESSTRRMPVPPPAPGQPGTAGA